MTVKERFAFNLKRIRKGKFTQRTLADELSTEQATVARWETATNLPDSATIDKISNVFKISVGILFQDKPPPTISELTSIIERQEADIHALKERLNIKQNQHLTEKEGFDSPKRKITSRNKEIDSLREKLRPEQEQMLLEFLKTVVYGVPDEDEEFDQQTS